MSWERTVQILPTDMNSLPIRICQARAAGETNASRAIRKSIQTEDEESLRRAFRSFTEVSSSLENSYSKLRAEVERLSGELAAKNADLSQSLEQNRHMRSHLDHILQSLPCGVIVSTSDGHLSTANPKALELLGMTSRFKDGFPLSDLPTETRDFLDAARQQLEPEMKMSCANGSVRWLAARHAPMGDAASVFILRDVTVQKSLVETQEKLRREQSLAEVSTVLAHEIRNPLGSLELFTGLLAETRLNAECKQWVEHLQAGMRSLAATVNNVVQFHSGPELERVPVDLGQLLELTRDFLMPLARQSNVALGLQNRISGFHLCADRYRLQQVLLNLILNSVKAMPEGGWIELGGYVAGSGNAVTLAVTDTGPGISGENLPRIFEPGFTTRAGSPGLGLAVCRRIVEEHGGYIAAENRAEGGAQFTITFPLPGRDRDRDLQ